ncbi:hypothetical protein WR25_10088 isoform A [Diploscapter pachys]|uniref:SH2 domain-containing protein n=5 Tax=Diploscapter pachys TaxID=2018661 RepID=A0A2A2LFC5_9BILA|nr:hypothetical protein WR25_10088 isoform A [Diploscapter pachys]
MALGMPNCSLHDMHEALVSITKETHALWEENKDLQGSFINDLGELQRIQVTICQLENNSRGEQAQHLFQTSSSVAEMQRRASEIYDMVIQKRAEVIKKMNEGTNIISVLQNTLINERLYNWKNQQKLAQVGVPFDNRDTMLDEIQLEFEFLAEQNFQLHTYTCWMLDLLRRGPNFHDNNAQTTASNLQTLLDQLSKLIFVLVSQSFVASVQPEPVLKTQHKFMTEVRLLIGDKLGVRQHLANTSVNVKIISEEEAKMLSANQLNQKDIKSVGTISSDFEKLIIDERGHRFAAKFNNSKLTRIAHRKPPPKAGGATDIKITALLSAATDQKYALLFNITPFQIGLMGKFDVWTLSLPLMVTVHGSQDCDAQGSILWHRAFASVTRAPGSTDIAAVPWSDLSTILKHKFSIFTGAKRPLMDHELAYLSEKLIVPNMTDQKPITFYRFAKQNLREDANFSFWEWFFSIMQLIKQKLLKFWDEGWLVGFISKNDASQAMLMCEQNSFLMRFSDTLTGAISIGFVYEDENGQNRSAFHLAPFTIKDLEQLSLAQRIATCQQLKNIRFLYPNIDKEEMLKYFEQEERHRTAPDSPTGYIQSEIVMVAKTSNKQSIFGAGDSPSPSSALSRVDWSPSDMQTNQSMELNDDIANMLSSSGMESMDIANVESLLGPAFRPFQPQDNQHTIDLSFIGICNDQPMNGQGECSTSSSSSFFNNKK